MGQTKLKILYVDMGGVSIYSCDKNAGRILGWVEKQNSVFVLVPKLIINTIIISIVQVSKYPEKIKIFSLPFSSIITNSSLGIIFSYFTRILMSPYMLVQNTPHFDIGYSNSPVLVDIVPILWLKLFGKCEHWVLMFDSVVPHPSKRSGNILVNIITYLESIIVTVLASRFASIVFTVNEELKIVLVDRGITNKKIQLSQNGLFLNKIRSVSDSVSKDYDAVYMGRISKNKGVMDLIKVWGKLVIKKPKAKLAVMGSGLDEIVSEFRKNIKDNGLDKNIDYLGFTPGRKKYEVLKNSKVFLYLSRVNADESWGISLMEALACGLPAISYDLPIYEHIYKTNSLTRVKNGNTDTVVEKLTEILDNKNMYSELSNEAKHFASKFNWFKIADADLKIIKQIIQSGE